MVIIEIIETLTALIMVELSLKKPELKVSTYKIEKTIPKTPKTKKQTMLKAVFILFRSEYPLVFIYVSI